MQRKESSCEGEQLQGAAVLSQKQHPAQRSNKSLQLLPTYSMHSERPLLELYAARSWLWKALLLLLAIQFPSSKRGQTHLALQQMRAGWLQEASMGCLWRGGAPSCLSLACCWGVWGVGKQSDLGEQGR